MYIIFCYNRTKPKLKQNRTNIVDNQIVAVFSLIRGGILHGTMK